MSAITEAIIHDNPHERLYVTPLEWTDRHMELLHIYFVDLDEQARQAELAKKVEENKDFVEEAEVIETVVLTNEATGSKVSINIKLPKPPSTVKGPSTVVSIYADDDTDELYAGSARRLAISPVKAGCFAGLIAPTGPLTFQAYGFFQYGLKFCFRMMCGTYRPRHPEGQAPILSFIQRQDLQYLRSKIYQPFVPSYQKRVHDVITDTIRSIQTSQLEPAIPHEDAYIALTLLGLAQGQAKLDTSYEDPNKIYKVRAVFADALNWDSMWLYKADITAGYLARFGIPAAMLPLAEDGASTSVHIKYKRISFAPAPTLRHRILEEVFSD